MSDTNFTPGPWFLSPKDTFVRAEGVHGWNIATIEDQPPYTKANAKLISKAWILPELVLACESLLTVFKANINGEEEQVAFDDSPTVKMALSILEKAKQ